MKCHCCGKDYFLNMPCVYECLSCGHTHCDYPGDSIQYHQIQYRNLQRRDWSEINQEGKVMPLFHEKRREICLNRLSRVSKYLGYNDTCLDIGGGAGTFASHLKPSVAEVECTELAPLLINEARALGFNTYDEDFLKIDFNRKYDFVFAWHVLEHVDDPEQFLIKTKELSNKYVVIEIPLLVALNGEGRQRKLRAPKIDDYDGHAHLFCEKSFRTMAERHFNIVELVEGVQSPALLVIMEHKDG